MCAAIEAARAGASVILVEDKPRLGGQLVKQTHKFFGSKEQHALVRGIDIAALLSREIEKLPIQVWTSSMAIGFFQDGVVGVTRGNATGKPVGVTGAFAAGYTVGLRPRRIVIATGAYENVLPFPNNDLPGVYGAGAVQTLMNEFGILPGRRVLMVGGGNIGLIVSYQLMQAGVRVVLLVEAAPRFGGYEVHAAKLRRLGVPLLTEHSVLRVSGKTRVERATITAVKNFVPVAGTEFDIKVDTVCIAVGLSPLTEFLWSAGCAMEFVPELGGYVAWHDATMRTSREDIYVAGDASGIGEASSAMVEGRLAGLSAAASLGFYGDDRKRTEEAIRTMHMQLLQLRQGPFGEKARTGKGRLWRMPYEEFVANIVGHEYIENIRRASEGKTEAPPRESPRRGEDSVTHILEPVSGERTGANSVGSVGRAKAVIECFQRIPCNPCVAACKFGAISMGESLVSLPVFDESKCTGCGACLSKCPGLAIFLVKAAPARNTAKKANTRLSLAEVTIPYEFLPLPRVGQRVWAISREGKVIGRARVTKVRVKPAFDRTALVTLEVPSELANDVRHFSAKRPPALEKIAPVRAEVGVSGTGMRSQRRQPNEQSGSVKIGGGPPADGGRQSSGGDNDVLICRCEEIWKGEISRAIDEGNQTFDDLKRILRCGMGSCQGKGCQPLVLDMLAKRLGKSRGEFLPATVRAPARPTLVRILADRRTR